MIGDNIKEIRKSKDMKSVELAEKSGYAASYVSDIENNKTIPNIRCLEAIAKALDCSIARLVDDYFYMPGIDEPLNMKDYTIVNNEKLFHELQEAYKEILSWDERDIQELLIYMQVKREYKNRGCHD